MKTAEFAKKCGVDIVYCDPEKWGGEFAYKVSDVAIFCGSKTEEECIKRWMSDTFGFRVSSVITELLECEPVKDNDES